MRMFNRVPEYLLVLMASVLFAAPAAADSGVQYGPLLSWTGTQTLDTEELFTADAAAGVTYHPNCELMSVTGAVKVLLSLDGTNFATAALALQDFGATDNSSVTQTVAGRVYGFVHGALAIRVVQVGDTDTLATLNCWKDGGG